MGVPAEVKDGPLDGPLEGPFDLGAVAGGPTSAAPGLGRLGLGLSGGEAGDTKTQSLCATQRATRVGD